MYLFFYFDVTRIEYFFKYLWNILDSYVIFKKDDANVEMV